MAQGSFSAVSFCPFQMDSKAYAKRIYITGISIRKRTLWCKTSLGWRKQKVFYYCSTTLAILRVQRGNGTWQISRRNDGSRKKVGNGQMLIIKQNFIRQRNYQTIYIVHKGRLNWKRTQLTPWWLFSSCPETAPAAAADGKQPVTFWQLWSRNT